MNLFHILTTLSLLGSFVESFAPCRLPFQAKSSSRSSFPNCALRSAAEDAADDDEERQWQLFRKHHARGSWKGIWTTYDYMGDVMDETVASVNYYAKGDDSVEQTHTIVTGAKRSDCATCFDSMEQTEFPVRTYTYRNDDQQQQQLAFAKTRFAANAMVNGPSLLRSGVMATELILSWGDGRVRVTFQHAPVWQTGVEPGSGPPQGLKLIRTMVSREALRPAPPTPETEAANPPTDGNPIFHRPVPPFHWYKKWGGTSWTWGPNSGDRGWAIENLEEEDAWQGISTVERWNLRLPGGIFMQAPRVITDMNAELCRLAWLPDDESLLRVEVGCLALQPMLLEDDQLVGFYPPSLASLRCDVLKNLGELDEVPSFLVELKEDVEVVKPIPEKDNIIQPKQKEAKQIPADSESATAELPVNASTKPMDQTDKKSGLQAVRDARLL